MCMDDGNCTKSVSLKIHIIYLKPFGDAIYGRCCTSYLSIMSGQCEALRKKRQDMKSLAIRITTNIALKAVESKLLEDVLQEK